MSSKVRLAEAIYRLNDKDSGSQHSDRRLAHVPGTVLLNDLEVPPEERHEGLKHATGRDTDIVLSPQPSEDPNDPLNWSPLKKELIFVVLLFGGMLNTATNVRCAEAGHATMLTQAGSVPECIVL